MVRFAVPLLLLVAGSSSLFADDGGRRARDAEKDRTELAKQLAGLTPGKPQQCMPLGRSSDSARVGDTILYKLNRNDIYRTDTSGGCFGLRRGDAIVTRSYTGQLCRGDIIQTVDLVSRMPSGSCTFGEFVRYRKQ
ncbi:hypothetical protein [Sphingomonas sp. PAMC 26617]|uniref:hypothetical protein n=1 Tax=Sphingomonas sp. PAMC 26617 TaxID=1112216 RepID=UPI00031282CE|nr:hypothetical protein [Sphingomonas sp. PAMC 26617]